MSQIKIDTAQIPGIEMKILCTTLVERMKIFYDDPENVRRFEEWKKNRDALRKDAMPDAAVPAQTSRTTPRKERRAT